MIRKKGIAGIMAFVLTACMVMSMSPVAAFAQTDAGNAQEKAGDVQENGTMEEQLETADSELTPVEYLSPVYNTPGDPGSGLKEMEKKTCTSYTVITEDMKEWTDENTDGWYVLSSDVNVRDVRINILGDVHVILCDGKTYDGSPRWKGIDVSEGNSLAVYGQTQGTGKINIEAAKTYINKAVIGGNEKTKSGKIVINGGTINVDGYEGAGIGGGENGIGENIIINGGNVTAKSYKGAGIGGGKSGDGKNIIINGGNVTAGTTNHYSAGIGGGEKGAGTDITINGGKVDAYSYFRTMLPETVHSGGAGIGGGDGREGSNITINGGNVTANGCMGGAGIGGGEHAQGKNITIDLKDGSKDSVEAHGGKTGAGIGGGEDGDSSNIVISSGIINSYGGSGGGAGVGGGEGGNGNDITIETCTVHAYGGKDGGAGIGGGEKESGGGNSNNIVIDNATVTANGGEYGGAGIGGGEDGQGLDITIKNGSDVTAKGDDGGAGIGGGQNGLGRYIDIFSGSNVKAYGDNGTGGAGIGGGENAMGDHIDIRDSTVSSWGGDDSAGIGGGEDGGGYNIEITNSKVTAYGDENGAGIGGGEDGETISITVNSGEVKAHGGYDGAGIGGGDSGKANNIRILGGKVEAYGGNGGGAGIGGGYDNNADGIYFKNCEVIANGGGTGDGVGSAQSSDRSSNIKVYSELYLNAELSGDSTLDRSGDLYNVHNVRISNSADTAGEKTEHNWSFAAGGPVITAECSNPDHESYTPEQITLEKPENAAYNGKCKEVRVNGSIDEVDTPDVKYYSGSDKLSGAPVSVGTYTAKATLGEGEGAATAELTFAVNPPGKAIKSVNAGKKKLTVKWKKSSKTYRVQTTGYQIMYSASADFANAKTVTVKAKYTSKTIKKLKSHKKYYVKMRAYKTVDGQKYYSTWSEVKAKKTR